MFGTTKMSSKGQIVIPEAIRDNLKLEAGAEFIIISQDENLILKKINLPPRDELRKMLDRANAKAVAAGMTENDIVDAISQYRAEK